MGDAAIDRAREAQIHLVGEDAHVAAGRLGCKQFSNSRIRRGIIDEYNLDILRREFLQTLDTDFDIIICVINWNDDA